MSLSNNASFINEERHSAMRSCLDDGDSDDSSVVVWNTQLCSFCKCLLKWLFVLYFRLHVHVCCFDSTSYISLINSSWLSISAACAVTVGKLSANKISILFQLTNKIYHTLPNKKIMTPQHIWLNLIEELSCIKLLYLYWAPPPTKLIKKKLK